MKKTMLAMFTLLALAACRGTPQQCQPGYVVTGSTGNGVLTCSPLGEVFTHIATTDGKPPADAGHTTWIDRGPSK